MWFDLTFEWKYDPNLCKNYININHILKVFT